MKKKTEEEIGIFFIFAAFLLFIILFIIFTGPENLVDMVGMKNTYFITFLAALITGVSVLTGVYFYTIMVAFGLGGANPILLGLAAGVGLTISDWLFYYLGLKGRTVLSEKNLGKVDKFSNFIKRKPSWILPLIVLIYTSITPFPTDIIMASVGLLGIKYRKVVVPLFIGNVVSSILVVLITNGGLNLFA